MKSNCRLIPLLALVAGLSAIASAFAHEEHKKNNSAEASATAAKGKLVRLTEKDAAWAAKARAAYPNICIASDEKLEGPEKPVEFIYREAGKPDRLVMFCCEGCGDDFMKEPPKYLAKLDAALKAKSDAGKNTDEKAHKANHD